MLEAIEKLLILQERDRQITNSCGQLAQVAPERDALHAKAISTQAGLDAAKLAAKHIESGKKQLELDVEAKKTLIEKYANQQLLTRKNEEYKALAHEIEMAKAAITGIEDKEIELMEQAEAAAKQVAVAKKEADDAKKLVDEQISNLNAREENLKKEVAQLETNRNELAAVVDESARSRYDRLLKNKGGLVVVGIEHGVCGGCHMTLQTQTVVTCKAQQDIVTCPNCGRILYFTHDMDMAVAD